ncbi:hypothetical protein [Ornithinimicrobium kibberense]|uniref:hypothetical protein n=1 Tax=Ornithinimicrobium kibberense TaxID=282060 RepID=UPI0036121025
MGSSPPSPPWSSPAARCCCCSASARSPSSSPCSGRPKGIGPPVVRSHRGPGGGCPAPRAARPPIVAPGQRPRTAAPPRVLAWAG